MIRALSAHESKAIMGNNRDAGFGALETERGCLPLESLTVTTRIERTTAHTLVRQSFINVFADPLEATYIFPMPPRSAVVGFWMTVNGREVAGKILERGEARVEYEEAIAEGRTAAITEEERPNVFTLRVGNIPAHKQVAVTFTLVESVCVDEGEATYRFPLVVAPRYCPGAPLDGEPVGDGVLPDTSLVPDASRISPPVLLPGMQSPVALSITALFSGGSMPQGGVACSLPVAETHGEDGHYVVDVVPEQALDRDFILRWAVGAGSESTVSAVMESDGSVAAGGLGSGNMPEAFEGEGTFELTIVPPSDVPADTRPRDILFLLDRSGSMGGWRMKTACRAVLELIETLTSRDRVEVIAFDTEFECVGKKPRLRQAQRKTREQLLKWIDGINARGGTALDEVLRRGLDALATARMNPPKDSGQREQTLVVLTDGLVGHEAEVLRRLEEHAGNVRVCAIGIAQSVNDSVLGRMADATGGIAELVESDQRLDEVLEKLRRRLGRTVVSNLSIAGNGIELVAGSMSPRVLPSLCAGLPVVVRGRYRRQPTTGHDAAPPEIVISGVDATGQVWNTSSIVAPAFVEGVRSLWARSMLRQLEDSLDARRQFGEKSRERRQQLLDLSLAAGVLCRVTAVIAIDPHQTLPAQLKAPPRRIVMPVSSGVHFALDPMARTHRSYAHGIEDAVDFEGYVADPRPKTSACRPERVWRRLWELSAVARVNASLGEPGGSCAVEEALLAEIATELHAFLKRLKRRRRELWLTRLQPFMEAVIAAPTDLSALRKLRSRVKRAESIVSRRSRRPRCGDERPAP